MFEFEMIHKVTAERIFIWGYNLGHAMRNHNMTTGEWTCLGREYID